MKNKMIGIMLVTAAILGPLAATAADNKVVWLDEMNVKYSSAGGGETRSRKSAANQPLKLRGKPCERGIGI